MDDEFAITLFSWRGEKVKKVTIIEFYNTIIVPKLVLPFIQIGKCRSYISEMNPEKLLRN